MSRRTHRPDFDSPRYETLTHTLRCRERLRVTEALFQTLVESWRDCQDSLCTYIQLRFDMASSSGNEEGTLKLDEWIASLSRRDETFASCFETGIVCAPALVRDETPLPRALQRLLDGPDRLPEYSELFCLSLPAPPDMKERQSRTSPETTRITHPKPSSSPSVPRPPPSHQQQQQQQQRPPNSVLSHRQVSMPIVPRRPVPTTTTTATTTARSISTLFPHPPSPAPLAQSVTPIQDQSRRTVMAMMTSSSSSSFAIPQRQVSIAKQSVSHWSPGQARPPVPWATTP